MALKSRIPEIVAELEPRIAAAMQIATDLVEAQAKERVPVRTGKLRDAIHTEFEVRQGQLRGYVVAGDHEAWYGHIVEHGSVNNMPPHPFLVPALEDTRGQIHQDIADVLRTL